MSFDSSAANRRPYPFDAMADRSAEARTGTVDDNELDSGYLEGTILHLRYEHMNNLSAAYI